MQLKKLNLNIVLVFILSDDFSPCCIFIWGSFLMQDSSRSVVSVVSLVSPFAKLNWTK